MRFSLLLATLGMLVGCGGGADDTVSFDSGLVRDAGHDAASIPHHDMGVTTPLFTGAACKITSQCGPGGQCLHSEQGFPAGYCTKPCSSNTDCENNSICAPFGPSGGTCIARCQQPSDCRQSDGYACWILEPGINICLLDQQADSTLKGCDPTAGDGTCMTESGPGGCVRYRLGTGNSGACQLGCELGIGNCPSNYLGAPQECIVDDERSGGQTVAGDYGDKFVGALCQPVTANAIAGGLECLYDLGSGPAHYYNACVDGYACDLDDPQFDPNGDNKCHAFCYPDGPPDGGVSIPDNGVVAAACDGICKRLWDVSGQPPVNLGLCIPNASSPQDLGTD